MKKKKRQMSGDNSTNGAQNLNKLKFVILTTLLMVSTLSCRKNQSNDQIPLNPLVLESNSYYQKYMANSPSSTFHAANLTIYWEKAEVVKQKFVNNLNLSNSLKSNGSTRQNLVQPPKPEMDKWGNIELFSSNSDYQVVKIPATLKLKDGRVLMDNRFIYLIRDKKGVFSISMVQYSKNKSTNIGNFTGKILITTTSQGKTGTVVLDFIENQINNLFDHSSLRKNAGFKNRDYKTPFPFKSDEDPSINSILYYFECPGGLTWNDDLKVCDFNGSGCPGYYEDADGNYYDGCESSESSESSVVGGIDDFSISLFGFVWAISNKSLQNAAVGGGFLYFMGSELKTALDDVPWLRNIITGIGLTSILCQYYAVNYKNGIIITFLTATGSVHISGQ